MSESVAKREIMVPELAAPISHYAHAVAFGNLVFVSGVVGHDPESNTIPEGVADQAQHLFRNMRKVLDAIGATPADVLKVTVFLTNARDHKLVTPVRSEFFGSHLPASTLVEVKGLVHPSLKVEIEAIVGLRDA
jgi:2-iminobutanoate/2-iminopropanoate deaminase